MLSCCIRSLKTSGRTYSRTLMTLRWFFMLALFETVPAQGLLTSARLLFAQGYLKTTLVQALTNLMRVGDGFLTTRLWLT